MTEVTGKQPEPRFYSDDSSSDSSDDDRKESKKDDKVCQNHVLLNSDYKYIPLYVQSMIT